MTDKELDFGTQPIATILADHGLRPNDLVRVSTEQITHKMISRAMKGRRLTPHVRQKILLALNAAAKKEYTLKDLFTY